MNQSAPVGAPGRMEMTFTTTLNRIRAHSPCRNVWLELLSHLGKTSADDEPLSYATILEANGLEDALWCCRAEPKYDKHWRLFAVFCANQVRHLLTREGFLNAIDVADAHAHGKATDEYLRSAREASVASLTLVSVTASAADREASREAAREASWALAWPAKEAAWGEQREEFLRIVSQEDKSLDDAIYAAIAKGGV